MQTASVTQTAPQSSRRPLAARAPLVVERVRITDEARAERDALLVSGLVSGDPVAWRKLTSEYSAIVIGCIRRVLSRFSKITNDHDVDEIYARFCFELLANDMKKLRYYDPTKGTRLSTWLGLLATNATYDYLRRLRREQVNEAMPERDVFAANTPSPLELVTVAEQAKRATELLGELSERDRQFVELYFAEGLDPELIAEKMGINLKTVYTKKHKITARLEAIMARAEAA